MSGIFTTPLRFEPVFKKKIWGGGALRLALGKAAPMGCPVGESWEISGWGGSQTAAADGGFKGAELGELFARDPQGLTGKNGRGQKSFPLMFKFIDAQEDLSIQVHPNSAQARANGWGDRGKTEAWYIVDAKPDARIALGFNRGGVTPEDVSAAVKNGTLETLLNFIPVNPGDTFFIPAGTVHAIMGGVLIYEIQEESDTTLRLYDWNRKGMNGEPRDLHVEDALSIIKFDETRPFKPEPLTLEDNDGYRYETLCDNSKFTLNRYIFKKPCQAPANVVDGFKVITVISGAATLRCGTNAVRLNKGETVLIPADLPDARLFGDAGAVALATRQQRPDWGGPVSYRSSK